MLERIFWFDDQVRRNRYPNAAKLAEKFELSCKTAQRCIEAMRDRFNAPLMYNPSQRGYFYDESSFEMPRFQVGQEEILSLLLAKKLLSGTSGGIISRHIDRFNRKLLTETGTSTLDAADVESRFSAIWTGHSPADTDKFARVSRALLTSRPISIRYASPGSEVSTRRTVEPHHLQYYMASWVLIAWCRLRKGWRKFYIARMRDLMPLAPSFAPRPESQWRHLVDGAFGIFQGKESITVVLRFTPFRARWIREQCWHPDQEMVSLEDGGLELRLPVADFREIKMKILQFGADVTVVAPEALKREIAGEIRKMAELY